MDQRDGTNFTTSWTMAPHVRSVGAFIVGWPSGRHFPESPGWPRRCLDRQSHGACWSLVRLLLNSGRWLFMSRRAES